MNILLVCTGNTCRSPMAEGLLKKVLPEHFVSSAGIYAAVGEKASANAVFAAGEKDIDLTAHTAKQITDKHIADGDLILCMTRGHKASLKPCGVKCFTLGEYTETGEEVSDPFGGGIDEYRECINQLERLIKIAAEKIRNENNPS